MIEVNTMDCCLYAGSKSAIGYGRITIKGKVRLLHREMYELENGMIPPGLHIDHLCRNPPCFHPPHLEAVTQKENNRRQFAASGLDKTCKNGHTRTVDNTYIWHGTRYCKACAFVTRRVRYLKRKGLPENHVFAPSATKDACSRGHAYALGNYSLTPKGTRRCNICRKITKM